MDKDETKDFALFLEEVDNVRKEKTEKGLKYKELLKCYKPKTKVDLERFKEKLEKMLAVEIRQ